MTQMLSANAAVAIRQPGAVVFPPRTFLYHLAPHAPESLWCESLTSYLNRLARSHHVSPRSLVAEVINPLLPSPDPFVAAFGAQAAMGLNGNGEQSKDWQAVLERLTGQIHLHRFTVETFLGDFPPKKFSAGLLSGAQRVLRNGNARVNCSINRSSGCSRSSPFARLIKHSWSIVVRFVIIAKRFS
jgi:hypothetical protein